MKCEKYPGDQGNRQTNGTKEISFNRNTFQDQQLTLKTSTEPQSLLRT